MFTLAMAGSADPPLCPKLAERYEAAVAAVADALRTYEKCVSASRGHDACLGEFSDLDEAQDRFETAVADYARGCR